MRFLPTFVCSHCAYRLFCGLIVALAIGVGSFVAFVTSASPASAAPPDDLTCAANGASVTWTDAGASKYRVYRSTDGGLSWPWLARTNGETSFVDPNPVRDARYQVDSVGVPRTTCEVIAPLDFTCSSYEERVRWRDFREAKYWVYRSVDDGVTWTWLGRALGATTFVDPSPDVDVRYQVHFPGQARTDCEVLAPVVFDCASFGGRVAWSDTGRSKYWVYRSVDDGATWNWLGRTLGATTFVDPSPVPGAIYQAHYAGLARQTCRNSLRRVPSDDAAFSCTVVDGNVSWSDAQQPKYWIYRSVDDGATWSWLDRTLGTTTFVDPNPAPLARYQVHYAGIPRETCRAGSAGAGRILLEGESTVARLAFTAEVARYVERTDLVNDGHGGDQITLVNSEPAVQPANIAGRPDIAMLWIGINDLSANRQPDGIYADMAMWATNRRADGWEKIMVLTVTRFENPVAARSGLPIEVIEQRRRELNDLIAANVMGADAIVDLRSIAGIGDTFSVHDRHWRTDGVHFTGTDLSGDAYVVLGELVGRTLAGLLP